MEGWRSRARFLGPSFAFAFGLLLTSHAWGKRPPGGDDVMAMVIRASEGARVLRSFHLDGWSPRFLTGFPVFLHYGPGLAVAYALVRVLSFGLVSPVGAMQVLMAVAFAAIGPATWFLARSLGMTERASTGAAILSLAVNSPFGVGLAGMYTIGLLPHALAAPFVLVGLGCLIRSWTQPDEIKWIRRAALCFAVVIATHVISTLIAAIFAVVIGVIVVTQRAGWRERLALVRRSAIVGIGAAGLAAFWVLPYLRHFKERGIVPAWATPTLHARIDDIVAGRFALGHYVALFVVAGWAWALLAWRRERSLAFAAPMAALIFMIVAHWYFAHSPNAEVAQQLANRGVGYACVLAIIPLGGLIDELMTSTFIERGADVGLVLATVLIVAIVPGKPALIDVPKQQGAPTPVATATAARLRRIVPDGARFATERNFPAEIDLLGMSHPDFWFAQESGRNTVNTYNLELSQSGGAGSTAENLRDDKQGGITAERFARFGVTHVVTLEPAAHTRLLATGEFREVFDSGPVSILRVKLPKDQPDPKSLVTFESKVGTASLEQVGANGGEYKIRAHPKVATMATVAVGWSSAWQVRVDGDRVPAHKSADGLVAFQVPQGQHEIALRFHRDWSGVFGVVIGIATALWLWLRGRP